MSNKMWEATIEHARECNLDYNKFYSYNSGQGIVLLLNCIYQPVGSIFGNSYCSLKELTLHQKVPTSKFLCLFFFFVLFRSFFFSFSFFFSEKAQSLIMAAYYLCISELNIPLISVIGCF